MFLTRIGFGSKAVITGDITQIDLPRGTHSGLAQVMTVLEGVEGIGFTLSPRATWCATRWCSASSKPTRPSRSRLPPSPRHRAAAARPTEHARARRRGLRIGGLRAYPAAPSMRRWVRAALGTAQPARSSSVRIVDEAEMRELNARYRHKDYPTNVLSFPADLPPGVDVPLLGDIVICAPVVDARGRRAAQVAARALGAHAGARHAAPARPRPRARRARRERWKRSRRRILAGLKFPDPTKSTELS